MSRALLLFSALATLNSLTSVLGSPIPMPEPDWKETIDWARTVSMPITRKSRELSRRSMIQAGLSNEEMSYFVDTQIGSPPQPVTLKIDTGSSDTWAFSPSACSAVNCYGGSFDPTQSSSFAEIATGQFSITYGDNSNKYGDYISDNLEINGVTIQGLEMGLALGGTASDAFGIMGVGFDSLEETATKYPNIIDDMVSQGLIDSPFYSLWLDDLQASTGTILFGGYDFSKYTGNLATLPIVPNSAGVYQVLQIGWNSLSITDASGTNTLPTDTFPQTVLLDSGTSLTSVPSDVFASLITYFNLQPTSSSDSQYYVDCSVGSSQGSLDFSFDGVTIQVPFSELALPIQGSSSCTFGLVPSSGSPILGDTFLPSAYVVYDLGNKLISLAQTVF